MEFWNVLYFIIWHLFFIALFLEEKYKKYILYNMLVLIWFVAAFRYNIGTDYYSYESLYKSWNIYSGDVFDFSGNVEPSFWLITGLLNEFGFSSQMLFLIYETIVLVALYKAIMSNINSTMIAVIVFTLYVLYPADGGYWWSMSFIRQAAGISIALLGGEYFQKKNYLKCFIASILAIMFHYSIIIMMPLYLLKNVKINVKIVYVLLVIGFIFNATGVNSYIIMQVISYVTKLTGRYEMSFLLAEGGTASFSIMAFWLSCVYCLANRLLKSDITPMVHNGAAIYILLRLYMSFGIEGSNLSGVVRRFEVLFLIYFIILIGYALKDFIWSQKNKILAECLVAMFMLVFCFMGINKIYQYNQNVLERMRLSPSAANIQYEFNFNLFR